MRWPISTCLLAAALAAPAYAVNLSLENAARELHFAAQKVKIARKARKKDSAAESISFLSSQVRLLEMDAARLSRDVLQLRLRAQRAPWPTRPGQPQNDPFLRSDLDYFVFRLRDENARLSDAGARLSSLTASAPKDPALAAPAQDLLALANQLLLETRSLDTNAQFALGDFQRAGFFAEASDIWSGSRQAAQASQDLVDAALQLLDKVK